MPLDTERYAQIRALFLELFELDDAEQNRVLDEQCAGDPALRAIVERLLIRAKSSTGMLDEIALEGAVVGDDRPSTAIENFQIGRKLGEGSMGTVYEARQINPPRTVALKVMGRLVTTSTARRFEHESRILALLQHPCIAQVYHAGTADFGRGEQAFFAMELVRGRPLVDHAVHHGLTIRRRLSLFMEIANAVHHAHQRGVIHRDLKPDNILVDENGCPKVLDFGVARLTDVDVERATLHTECGTLVGTLPYMSPEQASGRADEIDIRSDVYALGVVLFELLTERRPYEIGGLMLHDALRIVQETDPPAPSTMDARLDRDVDAIVLKAMERSRSRRYQSALEMAGDVGRFLSSQPITARPPSTIYQLSKLARRHRAAFGATAAALALLVLGVIGTSLGLVSATQHRQAAEVSARDALAARDSANAARLNAEQARDQTEAVTQYLESMLSSADPDDLGRDVLVIDVLDDAAGTVGERFANQPHLEARMRHTLGISYFALGRPAEAETHLARGLEIQRAMHPAEHIEIVKAKESLAEVLHQLGRYEEALSFYTDALTVRRRRFGPDHPDTLVTAGNAAVQYEKLGRFKEAEELALKTYHSQLTLLGADDEATLTTRNNLATVYLKQARFDDALPLYVNNLESLRRVLGGHHSDTLSAMSNLAQVYQAKGELDRAAELFEDVARVRRDKFGDEHPMTLTAQNNLATNFWWRARFDEAEALFVQTLAQRQRVLGREHQETLTSMYNLATLYEALGRKEESKAMLVEHVDRQRSVMGDDHPLTLRSKVQLCNLHVVLDEMDEALPLCASTLESARRNLGESHPRTITAMMLLGLSHTLDDRPSEGLPLLETALERARQHLPARHLTQANTLLAYGRCLSILGRRDEAEEALLGGFELLESIVGADHSRITHARKLIARHYNTYGDAKQAARW